MKILNLFLLTTVVFVVSGQQPCRGRQPVAGGNPPPRISRPIPEKPEKVLADAGKLEIQGRFKESAELLGKALASTDLSASERKDFEFELDRLDRIKKDFPLNQAGLFDALKKAVKGLTTDEFDLWLKEGRFDSRPIDGVRRFTSPSVSNLFFRYPELATRRRPPKDTTDLARRYLQSCRTIKEAARAKQTPYVLPKRFRTTMTVTAAAEAARTGEMVRAWLPVPRLYPYQTGFELVSASPAAISIDGPESAIRSVYLAQPAAAKQPVKFEIEYEYTRSGVCFDIQPDSVKPVDPNEAALAEFLSEGPHVAFTAEIRELSRQIVGSQTNPARKAKLIHDWIADHISYSFSIEYSTIRNISDYCRVKGYGDCGQEAFLFITLCRLNGIPARWQSGWNTFPGLKDIHDWAEIYLAPYGWVPVDSYMGIFAMRYAVALPPEQRREIRDFYFGGLDQFRMAANCDHCQALTPPKQSLRSDTVDFQRGELEHGTHNIYFDQFSYELFAKEVEPAVSNADLRGRQFLGLQDFSGFEKTAGTNSEMVLTSPVFTAGMPWDELIASWNADAPQGTYLKVEVRAVYPEGPTKFYTMGLWSGDSPSGGVPPAKTGVPGRESVRGQRDADGDVHTDTLALKRAAKQLQVRVMLGGAGGGEGTKPKLQFVGLSLLDTKAAPAALPPFRAAWNKLIPVPERSQMAYPNGGRVWCSPTTVSMLLAYWSQKLNRPELDRDVPLVAKEVYDPGWEGTGNWSMNMAFAGSFRGMRAYATRLSDVAELEQWIAAGIPVGMSVDYDRLRGKAPAARGHLVACVGFTETGDPIINDPGTLKNVRKTFPRKSLVEAWSYSHNTVYLIYPKDTALPKDSFGHWDSWLAARRTVDGSRLTPGAESSPRLPPASTRDRWEAQHSTPDLRSNR